MEIKQPFTPRRRRRPLASALSAVCSAPLAAILGAVSIATTLAVVISTVGGGRTPAGAPLELICALVIAAVAATEASRPVRGERTRRRVARSTVRDRDDR